MQEYEVDESEGPQEAFSAEVVEEVNPTPPQTERSIEAANEALTAIGRGEDGEAKFQEIKEDPGYTPKTAQDIAVASTESFLTSLDREISTKQAKGEVIESTEIADKVTNFRNLSMETFGAYRAQIAASEFGKELDPEDIKEVAVGKYLQHTAAKVFDAMGEDLIGVAGDIGSMLFMDIENIRMNEVAKLVGVEYTALDALDYSDFIGRLREHIISLPAEEAVAVIDNLSNKWGDILGDNKIALTTLLLNLTGDYDAGFESLMARAGTAEQAFFVTSLATTLPKAIFKGANVLNQAAKLKDVAGTAKVVEKGLEGGLVGSGVDVIDAATSTLPGKTLDTLVPGADNSLSQLLHKNQEEVAIHLDMVDKVNNYGLGLTEEQKTAAVARRVEALKKEEGLTEIFKVEKDEKGFTVHYGTGDGSGDVHQRTAFYEISDVGTFTGTGESGYTSLDLGVTSPNYRFWSDKKRLVELPTQMDAQGAKIRESYDNAIRAAVGHLKGKSFDKVDAVLLKGDEAKKTYTREELIGEFQLTDEEVDGYLGIRQVVEHMYHAKNKQLLDARRAQGVKHMEWGEVTLPVKRYTDVQAARTAFRQANTHSHTVVKRNSEGGINRTDFANASDMTEEWITDQYADGYVLARSTDQKYIPIDPDTVAEWVLVKADDLVEPSGNILGRIDGYMPRIRKDGHFFVKTSSDLKVGNTVVPGGLRSTVRYFDNHSDAKTWVARQPKEDRDSLEIVADGEMTASEREMEYTNISGGIITGKRKQTEIPFGLEEQARVGEKGDALHGLQRYIQNLSKHIPIGVYRMGLRESWVKTAIDLGAVGKNSVGGFDDLIHKIDPRHPSATFLKDSHNEVSLISGIPTEKERNAMLRSSNIAEWFEGKGRKKAAAKLHGKNLEQEASGLARGLTFHSLLGMYNPAQYLVQASGALIAMSINPVHALKAIPKSMAYQVLDRMLSKNPGKIDNYLKWMEGKGIDTEGYKLWHQSGIKESITSGNVDYQGLWANLPYDAGTVRKVMANDTFFFKSGELVNARISFATAYDRWKSLNKGKTPDTAALQDIMARTEQYRLNMSKTNSAKFQKGFTALPTQFQQVNTKFFEKLFGKDFTTAEKTRMAAGQVTLFGAMGIPIGGFITPMFMDMLGIDAKSRSEGELRLIRNGALSWMFNDYLDINNVITGRMSLGGDFAEKVWNAVVEPTRVVEVVLGPSHSLYEKSENLIFNVGRALSADFTAEGMETSKAALVAEVLAKSAAQFASPVANSIKAYDMTHSPFYKNKAGKPLFEWADNNLQTVFFQAAGFSSIEAEDYFEVNNRNSGMIPASVSNVEAKRIVFIMNTISDGSTDKQKEAALYAISAIKGKYKRYEDRQKLIKQITTLIKHPNNAWETNVQKMAAEWESELNDGWRDILRMSNAKTNPRVARELEKMGVEK